MFKGILRIREFLETTTVTSVQGQILKCAIVQITSSLLTPSPLLEYPAWSQLPNSCQIILADRLWKFPGAIFIPIVYAAAASPPRIKIHV
jgi:hypothetical protein